MLKSVGKLAALLFIFITFSVALAPKTFAVSGCNLCILEFGTRSDNEENSDFVIIGNASNASISLSSVQLQYLNSLGIFDSRINLSGTLLPGQTKVFMTDNLRLYNPGASLLSFAINSGGGSLRLIKILTASTTEYDTVGWGSGIIYEGSPIAIGVSGHYYRSKNISGIITDSDNNANDFIDNADSCNGLSLNEVQPFATDNNGAAVESWVELNIEESVSNTCAIVTSDGNYYEFSPGDLGVIGDRVTIKSVLVGGVEYLLQLPNPDGAVAVAKLSHYSSPKPALLPYSYVEYSNLEKTQSIALIEKYGVESWVPTYEPTPNELNVISESPLTMPVGSPDACSSVYINEITPNPVGSDTGYEWIELVNASDDAVGLGQCVIEIDTEKYYFLASSVAGPGEYIKFDKLFDESGNEKSVSLRNTDETYVSLSRLYAEELTLLQSFIYSDAPEGMSYSRFNEGWAWTYALTPESTNIYQIEKPTPIITESKASFATTSIPAGVSSVAKATSSTKKIATSTKNLSSTAKATTGVKASADARDIYEEPEEKEPSNNYVFIVIGALAILYALYEYKTDLQNFYFKWRRNKRAVEEDRTAA